MMINIRIIAGGEEYQVSTFQNEYRSLMALIQDKLFPDSFGECGGVGRCATCQVQLENAQAIAGMDRNELSTLQKQGVEDESIRLSCQLLVDASLDNVTVVLVDG
ncbi:MAG: 2Fe-2S iron-sulfur cluster-binding protein [Chitinophaga sp.]